ncbi:uncharacterized protein LOC129599790 [Paramacrobiotus metropolitanus]|uniref:uncharacterized protein LOC129599790 n=1 Tax=Paramacrobiotus metropolitanus TaxID=2943436 RepID=UPI002445EE3C|nr:uncharacterized protein LOC129599790 [Paramacrobiotus metropolitanus]
MQVNKMFDFRVLFIFFVVPALGIRFQRPDDDYRPIIQLFQWPWNDVARLCTEHLQSISGMVVLQVSPPQPHRIINQPLRDRSVKRPWWERYQPTGLYVGKTRSGTADEFRRMIVACNRSGISIYAEVVLNHLVGVDAGLGRDSDGAWYSVDEQLRTMKVNGNTAINTLISSTESCSSAPDGNFAGECHPGTPYTFADTPVLKLDLRKDEVKQQIADFIVSLRQYGVEGISIISAGLSNIEQLRTAITEKLILSSPSNASLTENMFVYFEIRNEPEPEKAFKISEPSRNSLRELPDITYFSPRMAAHIRSIMGHGVDYHNETTLNYEHVNTTEFFVLGLSGYGATLSFGTVKIFAYEHHEVIHGDRYTAWGYPVFDAMDRADEVVATVLLLLTTPNLGIPRIVWDYSLNTDVAQWQGPPTYGNLTVVSVFETPSEDAAAHWDHTFPMEWSDWIIPVLRFRSEALTNYINPLLQTHAGFLAEGPTTDITPLAAFIMTFESFRIPQDAIDVPEQCIVTILLVPVNGQLNQKSIQSGVEYVIGRDPEYPFYLQLNSTTVSGDNLISRRSFVPEDQVSITSVIRAESEDDGTSYTTTIKLTAHNVDTVPFLLFSVPAVGFGACY